MATHFLGPQIDIHGGGFDLVFPHHSCEIAQTESITGARPFVQFWMHAGLVWLDGEKMSKSRGNLIFARDALTEHDASTLRWYLLGKPYRQEFNYERDQVPRAAADWERVRETLRLESGSGPVLDLTWVRQDFDAAMADDLDTPLALHLLSEGAYLIRTAATEGRDIRAAQAILAELVGVLGLQAG
jgi:L-cysteine:1D-myo-inositol 2-amino-2-deoxy-alpha-D-glucopyranoside ligase